MRKTKRSKRAVVVMLLMLLFAYGAVVTPRVQRHGWVGLVPETALVLSIPFLSDEAGTAMSFLNKGLRASGYEEILLGRFSADHGALPLRSDDLGWLNRRLVFWLAKRQSPSAVTDSSAVRGNLFGSLISSMIRRGRATKGEEAWANSVVYIEFDRQGAASLNEYVYSGFKIRRLKQGAYRLMIGQNKALYNGYTPLGAAIGARAGGGVQTNEDLIEQFRWDSSYKIAHSGGVIRDPEVVALGRLYQIDEQTGAVNVQVLILENEARRIDGDRWVVIGDTHRTLQIPIDEKLAIPTDADEEVGKRLEQGLRAKLTVEHDRGSGEWVPVVKLERESRSGFDSYDSVLFGGEVSVVVFSSVKGKEAVMNPRGIPVLKGAAQVWNWDGRGRPESRAIDPNTIMGQMEYAGFSLPNSERMSYEFRVEIDPRRVLTFGDYAGLKGDVMYPFTLTLPLDDWTAEEMTLYLVNGIVPQHAIPER